MNAVPAGSALVLQNGWVWCHLWLYSGTLGSGAVLFIGMPCRCAAGFVCACTLGIGTWLVIGTLGTGAWLFVSTLGIEAAVVVGSGFGVGAGFGAGVALLQLVVQWLV